MEAQVRQSKQAFRSRKSTVIHRRTAKAAAPVNERAGRMGLAGLFAVVQAACVAWGADYAGLLAQVRSGAVRLFISAPNAKLTLTGTFSFALPAAFACPGASSCLFACFAMVGNYGTITVELPRILNLLWIAVHGWEAWADSMILGIRSRGRDRSGPRLGEAQSGVKMPERVITFRWHDSGDWINQDHLDAAVRVMRECANVRFYCYTKSLHLDWREALALPNFNRVQSAGGKHDHLIDTALPHAILVDSAQALAQALAQGYTFGSDTELPAIRGDRGIVLVELSRKKQILADLVDMGVKA